QIDQILSSKPEDRRALFDEAAGIVKYKLRKEASIKKLEEEQQNLLRLNDILSELEKQVEPLSKQAETAKVYLKNRDRLKTLDVNLFLLDSSEQRKNLVETGQKLDTAKNDLSETKNRYEKARTDYDEMNAALEILEGEIEEARNNMTRSSVMKEKLEGQIGILQEQIRSARSNDKHFHERQNSLMEEISSIQRELEKQEEEKSRIDEELQAFSAAHQEARDGSEALSGKVLALTEQIEEKKSALLTSRLVQAQSVEQEQSEAILKYREAFEAVTAEIATLNQKQKDYESEIAGMKEKLTAYDTQLRSAQAGYHSEKSRLDALTNLTERYEGYGGSVKRVMEQKASVPGIIGVVADIIKTEEQYETAIETALGGSIQNVVTQDEETAKRLISFLKREHAGRATFLPLTSIRDHREFRESGVLKEPGVIALASSLVQMEDRYRDVAESLLGRIVVTRDIDSALKLASKYRHSLRIVTIGGEQLSPGGAISGGAFRNSSNLLGRRRELEALKDKVKNFEQSAREAQVAIAKTKERRNELRTEMETIRMTLQQKFIEQNTARLNVVKEEERQKEAEGSCSSLKKETEELGNRLQDIATRKE
ncbi:MAG: chromosome segregation protein SMC, partial [Lachnospiraceae bacterium]|nr:chromosome segregation protein SMC [Lachnospiraceae bacterium]